MLTDLLHNKKLTLALQLTLIILAYLLTRSIHLILGLLAVLITL